MTVAEQQTLVGQILGDTSNTKWSNANHILPALNTAQFEFVRKVLGYGHVTDKAYDVLSEIQASTTQSVDTTGYALSGLDSSPGPFISGGYVASKGTIDSEVRWIEKIPFKNLAEQNNDYLKGNDENPVCYLFTNTYYLIVDSGSYPISVTLYYIREPKELVASGASGYQATTCELDSIHHRLLCKMAAAECYRLVGDPENIRKYEAVSKEAEEQIRLTVLGISSEPSGKMFDKVKDKK